MSSLNSIYPSHEIEVYIPLHTVHSQALFSEQLLASVVPSNRMNVCVLVVCWG